MKEDKRKVSEHLKWLNAQTPGQNWVPLLGFNALTTASYNDQNKLVFNPNYGRPLKAFINKTTGEIKIFDAHHFYV